MRKLLIVKKCQGVHSCHRGSVITSHGVWGETLFFTILDSHIFSFSLLYFHICTRCRQRNSSCQI